VIAAGGKLWAAAFSPDGSRFALAGDDGVPQIWTMPAPVTPDELARVIRCRVPYEVKGDRVVSRALPGNCTAQ